MLLAVLILQQLLAELHGPLKQPDVDEHGIGSRTLLYELPIQITLDFLIVVESLSLALPLPEPIGCRLSLLHLRPCSPLEQLVVLLHYHLCRCPQVVIDQIVSLPCLTQIVAPWKPPIGLHLRARVVVEGAAEA